jgi:hypothetical protein
MSCDHSFGQNDILKIILFEFNNIVILSLIIFCLNCNQHSIARSYQLRIDRYKTFL